MGPNCSHLKLKMINCICGEVDGSESASCSDPFGECAQTESARDTCRDSTGFVHYCDRPVIGPPCNSATPTPTPTPSPTPPSSGCSADPRPACPHYACNYDTGRWECRGTSLDARAGRV
jgi:hypothetical protein